MKCVHTHRVSVHPSVKIGGVSIGQCENEALPGLTVCYTHATKDTVWHMLQSVLDDFEKATGVPHRFSMKRRRKYPEQE